MGPCGPLCISAITGNQQVGVVRAHMLPYQVQGVFSSLSINVTGQLSVLIPYLFQAMVCHPTASDGCWVMHSVIVAISISAELLRTATRNVSQHPSCTSPSTHCTLYRNSCPTFTLVHFCKFPFASYFFRRAFKHAQSSLLGRFPSNPIQYFFQPLLLCNSFAW